MNSILCYSCKTLNILAMPFCAVSKSIHRMAQKSNINASEADRKLLKEYNEKNVDLAYETTEKFLKLQPRLIAYRIERMKIEAEYLLANWRDYSMLDWKNWVCIARLLVRLVFVYAIGLMYGRFSMYPPLEPNSVFLQELQHKNPNY